MVIIAVLGLSSGLPIPLITGTLQAFLHGSGIDLKAIGLFGSVTLPFTLKFLWSPFLDRFSLTRFGRRKSWMLISQIFLAILLFTMGGIDPAKNIMWMAVVAMLVGVAGATQDIAMDAWRREILSDDELGFGSSVHISTYLFSLRLIGGAFALILSDHFSWAVVYGIMSLVVLVSIGATLICEEPNINSDHTPKSLKEAVVLPFRDYFQRKGAILILLFIFLYKVGDNLAQAMTIPFFLEQGFTKSEIGYITKIVGWVSLTIGGLVGGALLLRLSQKVALFVFGIFQALSTFAFIFLINSHTQTTLGAVIGFENFTAGLGSAAFLGFMASLTNRRFTATQYALLSSFMGLPRTLVSLPTGYMVENLGYFGFFMVCTLVAVPGLLLIRFLPSGDGRV